MHYAGMSATRDIDYPADIKYKTVSSDLIPPNKGDINLFAKTFNFLGK